jgi:hypothetical protein
MTDVVKIGLGRILIYFVTYIILHYFIIKVYEGKNSDLQKDTSNEKLQNEVKFMKIAKTWFPAIYVVILIIVLAT